MFQGASGMSESKKPADVQVSATPTATLTPTVTSSSVAPTATPTPTVTSSSVAPTATPTPTASTSPPLGYFFDQIGKVYYNSSVADIISYNASTKALSLDTTGNGSSDTTVTATVDTSEKYSVTSSRDYLAIYKTTPSQVWKMKVAQRSYSSTDNRTYYDINNSDYQDYIVGGRVTQNTNSLIVTSNIGNYITNEMDSEYTTDPKDFYVLYGGSLQSSIKWGVAHTYYIRLYIDGNYTAISVGDYLEIYIA
jgi:hypothetical protein